MGTKYILGLDLGISSCGWAVSAYDDADANVNTMTRWFWSEIVWGTWGTANENIVRISKKTRKK